MKKLFTTSKGLAQLVMSIALVLNAAQALAQPADLPQDPGPSNPANENPFLYTNTPIRLLQPPDDATYTLPSEPGLGTFFTYFNLAWPWIIGTAAGIAVLQALIGGMQMMLSGGDSGKTEEGKSKLMWAIAGLLLIGLSGVILETINPLFYRQV